MSTQTFSPTKPKDCPHFGQELPPGWRCPPCPLAKACFEAYENPTTFAFPDQAPTLEHQRDAHDNMVKV